MILIASCSLRLIYFCIFFFTNAIFNQFFSYFKGESYILKFYLMEHGFVVHKRICACPSLFYMNISSWYWSNNLCYFFVLERNFVRFDRTYRVPRQEGHQWRSNLGRWLFYPSRLSPSKPFMPCSQKALGRLTWWRPRCSSNKTSNL